MTEYKNKVKIKIFNSLGSVFLFFMFNSIVSLFCFRYVNLENIKNLLIGTSLSPNQIILSVVSFFLSLQFFFEGYFVKRINNFFSYQSVFALAPSFFAMENTFMVTSSLSNHNLFIFSTYGVSLYSLLLSLTIFQTIILIKHVVKPYIISALIPSNEANNEKQIIENMNNNVLPLIAIIISMFSIIFR